MAKVSLRIYNQEIENLVDRGQLDEAIAHCRHVLNTFPKNLESYRLIGKAYLEAKRYNEAIDIFERLIMAVPDDFVAHVGMSIINDEQKNLDAAIWHMQRAFEVQPSNAAIQAELQRLYGRRDGVEPPKIRLTRGALAHMYVQGELYPQAISEIKSVLEEDRERHDMQVLLARAYFHAGQKGEAAEMCSQLLRRYPYCLDASRVLVELLPETEHGENVQTYRQRVNEMDPYAAYATGSVFRSDEVSDAAVSLERLEWDGQPVDLGPAWGESLGIGLDEGPAESDEEPDWLKAALAPESTTASGATVSFPQGEEPAAAFGSLPVPTGEGKDEIPEFLREAGWGESTGAFQEGPGTFDESAGEPALAEGDIPDWVRAMAPTGLDIGGAAQQTEPSGDLTQDEVPDWLQGLGDVQSALPAEQPPTSGEDIPDWLESVKPMEEVSRSDEQPMAAAASDEELPDWLVSMQSEEERAASQEFPQEAFQEPALETPITGEEPLVGRQPVDEVPAGSVDADRRDTGSLGTSAKEQDDAIAWLEGLAAKHGAKPEELVTRPEDRRETEPDWVQQARGAGVGEPPAMVEEPVEEVVAPVELPVEQAEEVEPTGEAAVAFDAIDTGELGTTTEEQDDAIAWLEGLAAKHGARPEELVTRPEDRKESEPDWVQQAREAGAEKLAYEAQPSFVEGEVQPEQPVAEEPVPSAEADEIGLWLHDLGEEAGFVDEQAARPETKGDFTDWLSGLESKKSGPSVAPEAEVAPEMGITSEREATLEPMGEAESEPPDWLRRMEAESTGMETKEAPAGETAAEELPSWLAGLESPADQKPSEPAAVEELPDWLRMEAEEEPAQAEPTAPSDWRPAEAVEPVQAEGIFASELEEQPAPKPAAQVPAPPPVGPEPRAEPAAPPVREPYREPVTRSRSGMTGMLSAVQDPALSQAQNELTRGNIPGAMENYGKLIRKGKMLDEIIFDLREALYRYPVEVAILQTLGDAYMRANRLQEALDSYTKAEELLR
jgi:tetratricopeptide (TPR) repeat protein